MGCALAVGGLLLLGGVLWAIQSVTVLLMPLIGETAADVVGVALFFAIFGGMAAYNRHCRIARGGHDEPLPSSGIGSLFAVLLGAIFGFAISRNNRRNRW